MFKIIEKVRNGNEKDKQAFALLFAVTITGFVFVIWLVSFLTTLDSRFENIGLDKIPEVVKQEYEKSPIDEFIRSRNTASSVQFDIDWSTTTNNSGY